MPTTTPVASIGPSKSSQFIPAKVFDACTTMTAFTKNSNLVYEIALLQNIFYLGHKDIFLACHYAQ